MKIYYKHRACGGGVYFIGRTVDSSHKPVFQCSKCYHTWTCGETGGQWAPLVKSSPSAPMNRAGRLMVGMG